ncbi:MAG: hypothetical protein LC749_13335 [Actinobacteria bacterium]|nr:hypothetical protein [Actinomycetota bacterium]
MLVIALSAVGLVAKSAQPGDHLWGVTQVLYSDYARSVETAAAVRTELNEANTALRENQPDKARASLQRVQQQLPVIRETEGRTGSHRPPPSARAEPEGAATRRLGDTGRGCGVPTVCAHQWQARGHLTDVEQATSVR